MSGSGVGPSNDVRVSVVRGVRDYVGLRVQVETVQERHTGLHLVQWKNRGTEPCIIHEHPP